MKLLQVISLNLIVIIATACANKQPAENIDATANDTSATITMPNVPDSFPAGKIISNIVCKNDAAQSYALYLSPQYKQSSSVIYFFDAHGDGMLPLKNYKALADKYNYVLIASNNSKNGNDWQTTENIWQNLFTDTQGRLALNNHLIYTCGFSGGAKVASYIALHHNEVKGVIANSAGLPDETSANNFNFSFTGIAGKGDMNMTDLVALNNDLDKTQTKHRLILFNGKHEWAPESAMNIAFAGLQFDAMRNHVVAKNDSLIAAFIGNCKKRIDSCIKKNDFMQAENECILPVNMLDGITDINWFKQKDNSIKNETAYKNQLRQQENLFEFEQSKKAEYNDQFQKGDMNYWTKTITDLTLKSKALTSEGLMYQRLLAYLSLAFYSISNQLINNNQNKEAVYFVTLYKMADPTNSEAWYLSAILDARSNNVKAVTEDLTKAVENNFTDKNRMLQQPEFQNLRPQINFADIESKMQQ